MAAQVCRGGTDGYLAVYQSTDPRLAGAMLLLAAAIATASTVGPTLPDRQARATVRILRAEPAYFQEIERQRPALLRSTVVRGRDGKLEPVRLLEYQ